MDDFSVTEWRRGNGKTQTLLSDRTSSVLSLKDAFQYTHGSGLPAVQMAMQELTELFHFPPPEAKHKVTMTCGNADGVTKVLRMLGSPGDFFLADEFTFPPFINATKGYGVNWVPVKMDAGGLIPEAMEDILTNWDAVWGRRPHVVYLVP